MLDKTKLNNLEPFYPNMNRILKKIGNKKLNNIF